MFDKYEYKQKFKDIVVALAVLGFVLCPVYELILIVVFIFLDPPKKYVNIGLGMAALTIMAKISGTGLLNETNRGLIINWLFCPSPIQLLMMIVSCFCLLNFLKLILTNYKDWMLEDENEKDEKAIPYGKFNFRDKNHVLCVGTTGAGKTTFLKKLVQHHIKAQNPMVIISGKSAYNDPNSLLDETKKYCNRYNVPLTVVSLMDDFTEGYNPLRHLNPDTVADLITTVSEFSEEHYKVHTKTWILKICTLIRYMKVTMSLSNILALYDYDVFEEQAKKTFDAEKITKEQYERLIKDAENNAKVAADSKERFKQYLETETARNILVAPKGQQFKSFKEILKENGVLYLDLHGPSYSDLTRDMATFACGDIAEALNQDDNPDQHKLIIMDELSFTFNSRLSALYATARSTGAQIVSATQSLADLNEVSDTLCEKLIENSNAYAIFRQNSATDAEECSKILGTKNKAKVTQKADGNRYDPSGTAQITKEYKVHPDLIKEMPKLQMFYCNKDDGTLTKVKWSYDEETDSCEELLSNLSINNRLGNNL